MTQKPLAARNSDSGCLRGIEGMPSQRTTTFWVFRSRDGGRNSATICSLNLVLNICPDIIPYSSNSQSHSICDNFFRVRPLSTVAVVASNLGLPSVVSQFESSRRIALVTMSKPARKSITRRIREEMSPLRPLPKNCAHHTKKAERDKSNVDD
jgi:hypothetical protein